MKIGMRIKTSTFFRLCLAVMLTTAATMSFAQVEQASDSMKVTRELNTMDYVQPGKYILKDVRVHGVKYIDSELIINAAGLTRGEEIEIPGDYISSAVRKLWSQRFYSDIKAYVTIENGEAIIDLHMKERPRISRWEFTGVKEGENRQLREKMEIASHSELSDYVIHGAMNNIRAFFEDKGFINVDIDVTQRIDTTMKLKNNFVVLTFNVNKGEKMKIKNINFIGNNNVETKKLKGAMKGTKEKTLINLLKSAKFDEKKFEEDKGLLLDYLQSRGYRNAVILSDSLYQIEDDRLALDITIDEGNKFFFRDITFTGNTKHSDEELKQILGIKRGDTYDKKNLMSRLGKDMSADPMGGGINVSSIYNNAGHLAFSIEPVETVISGDSIDIDVRISEGKPFKINEVKIIGNTRTNDRVIRRELLTRPGELYSQDALIQSIRQVNAMGHFTENINPVPIPVSDGLVDIELNLEERPNDQLQLSGGWGEASGFILSVGVSFNNVSMRNFFKKSAWRPYPTGDNQKLQLSVQANGSYYQSFQASFHEPWLGGKKPNSFSISTHYSMQSNGNLYYGIEGDGSFATTGFTVSYGKRLSWPDPNFTLIGSFSYQSYIMNNWSYFILDNGTSNIVTLSGQVGRDSRDNFLFPRSGSELSLSLTATPPYSAFRSKGYYTNPDLTDEQAYKWIEFYQIEAKMKWFVSALANKNLIFMFGAEFGYLGHYLNTPKAISIFEGYSMGGDGITGYNVYGVNTIALRGYENEALTPNAQYGEQARLYNKFTFEIRYPIIMQATTSIYALAFAEGGNAFSGWRDYNPFNLKRSAGAGLRIFLPIVGMFGIDWGYGFDRVPGSSTVSGSQFHFSIGQQF